MNVLYIGGTGRISYSCVWHSARVGQQVTVFNRGKTDLPLPRGVERICGDIDDDAAYRKLGEREWDVICQFKAYVPADIQRDLEVFSGRCGQYVFISTAAAYQKPPHRWVITEDVPLSNPYWDYAQAKAEMESMLRRWKVRDRLPATIVRPGHTNSNRNFPGSFLSGRDLAWRMLNGRATVCHGDGTGLWVLTHADDFAVPFVKLLGNPRAIGETLHITSDEVHTWNEILTMMAAALDVESKIVHVPTETLVRCNPDWSGPLMGDKAWNVVYDNSKIRYLAGPVPKQMPLEKYMRTAAGLLRDEIAAYTPDEKVHDLLDNIAEQQQAVCG